MSSTHRHVVGVDVVGALDVLDRQQFDARVVEGQNVGVAILQLVFTHLRRLELVVRRHLLKTHNNTFQLAAHIVFN